MWVLGGRDNSNYVWSSSDGTNWANMNASNHWSARELLTSVVFDDKIWFLGGGGGGGDNQVWNSSDGISWVNTSAKNHWSSRNKFVSLVFDNKIWVLGGNSSDDSKANDVWYYTDP